ncbi:hypothetical protein GCM10022254_67030 [Actinomadura meridiana]|uniref:Uncharacterized protein n=1 Tax=Actinomadura meridiana TaxID=559626 RepID=A0ABP8CM51_9ACTN
MTVHHLAGEGETETGTARPAREPAEQPVGVPRVEAVAVVADGQLHRRRRPRHRHADPAARGSVAQRVVDERRQHPPQRRLRTLDGVTIAGASDVDGHAALLGPRRLGRRQLRRQRTEIDRVEPARDPAEPRRRQHVLDDLAELPGPDDEPVDVGADVRPALQPPGRELRAGVQPGQRRAQLVPDVRREPPPPREGLVQRRQRPIRDQTPRQQRDRHPRDLRRDDPPPQPPPLAHAQPTRRHPVDGRPESPGQANRDSRDLNADPPPRAGEQPLVRVDGLFSVHSSPRR